MRLAERWDSISCDVLVVGSGGTALRAAIEARERGAEVVAVSKGRAGYRSNTFLSKATVAAASDLVNPDDSTDSHLEDTLAGGRFINNSRLAEKVVRNAHEEILFLKRIGFPFVEQNGRLSVTHTPGHTHPRHVRGENSKGVILVHSLRSHADKIGVRFVERMFVTNLFFHSGRLAGAAALGWNGDLLAVSAPCAVLATGGFGRIYSHSDNAVSATGDGSALAFDAGVLLKDMEFIQFYPTALGSRGSRIILYENTVFQGGGAIRNSDGDDILGKYGLTDGADLTRDRLSRAVMQEVLDGRDRQGCVVMESRVSSGTQSHLVSPTAHFTMGGIDINEKAETGIPGLFAAGEVTAGVHGANRLGGNSLTEVLVMGGIAGREAARLAVSRLRPALNRLPPSNPPLSGNVLARERDRLLSWAAEHGSGLREVLIALRTDMWKNAGILRTGRSLREAFRRIRSLGDEKLKIHDCRELIRAQELQNMLFVSEMVCRAGLIREESRGAHYRSDFPEEDQKWRKNIVLKKRGSRVEVGGREVSVEIGPRISDR